MIDIRNLVMAMFLLSLSLLTYDSLPYIPFTVYRPVAMFPMFAASLLILFTDFRFKKGDLFLLGFLMYSIGHSMVVAAASGDIGSSFSHVVTQMFGLSMYRVSVYAAEQIKQDPELLKSVARCVTVAFVPPLAAGFLQLADAFVVKNGFSGALTGLFSEKVYTRRIQMLSGEPSWAAIHMLSGGLLMFFLYKRGFRKQIVLLVATALLMVLSFSSYAYTVLLLALVFYVLTTNKNRGRMIVILGACVLVIGFGVPYLIEAFNISGYFTDRFQFNFAQMWQNDNSVFVRIAFPAIGFIEFIRHPIFGLGGGFYHTEAAELLRQYFSSGLKFTEVYNLVYIHPEAATSRALVSKVFAEEGLIGVILFGGFLVSVFRSCGANPYSKFAFALCLSLVMNFDSYAFLNFWLLVGFIRGGLFDMEAVFGEAPALKPVRAKRREFAAKPIYSEWRSRA
ncbi:O-antigen ligase domain-containing protein [Paenibacillus thailandensis]|uniref:O-antigen ligase domain-containing protein n=1 Tax=Paenibacillus thailandensis TaxID=393250 RepID=A0ABW5QYI0_9BACL